jgi:hypothetical protein
MSDVLHNGNNIRITSKYRNTLVLITIMKLTAIKKYLNIWRYNTMKQQTFISKLLDENNRIIDFERWSDKRISTIENKLKELYTHSIYKRDIEKSTYIVIYEASDNSNQHEIKRMKINEFLPITI